MKIASVKIYQYKLPLKRPLKVRKELLKERVGLVIQLTSASGISGFGEIAPLPGFSKENFDQIHKQIPQLKAYILQNSIPDHITKLDGKFETWIGLLELKPSLRFGLEMAVLNLLANSRHLPIYKIISQSYHEQIKVSGLIQGNIDDVKKEATQMIKEGFTSIKLKVGESVPEDIKKVKVINEIIEGKALLHLDANQSWDTQEAILFGNEIGCAAVDYIEEPFDDLDRIPHFFTETLIPIALDESLQKFEFDQLKSVEGMDILIIKPTMLGGIEKTWQLIQESRRLAIDTVISSSFESDLGILALANLAGGCSWKNRDAGLDTLKWFGHNLLVDPLEIKNGKIDISNRSVQEKDINFSLLTPVL